MNFVVLSSSRGTTVQAIIDAISKGTLSAHCLGLITDRPDRGCVQKAEQAGWPIKVVDRVKGENRTEYDKKLDAAIRSMGKVDFIVAIGWMWLLSSEFVQEWPKKIINVHPSLLPKYPGAHAHRDVLAAKEPESGMTIHFIDEGIDTGTIILQKICPVLPGDTEETLKARVQELEKEWYPKVLQDLHEGSIHDY